MELLIKIIFTISSAHGQLTIRLLLDINETCLRSQGFFDLWKQRKKFENEGALASLRSRLAEVDALPDDRQRWIELCRGVLAGSSPWTCIMIIVSITSYSSALLFCSAWILLSWSQLFCCTIDFFETILSNLKLQLGQDSSAELPSLS